MTQHYPVIFETEEDGAISAYVAGLPIYAQANTEAEAAKRIQDMLVHWFEEHRSGAVPRMRVARIKTWTRARTSVELVGTAALMGGQTSTRKARSSRANGKLGGRPRKAAAR